MPANTRITNVSIDSFVFFLYSIFSLFWIAYNWKISFIELAVIKRVNAIKNANKIECVRKNHAARTNHGSDKLRSNLRFFFSRENPNIKWKNLMLLIVIEVK